MPQQPARLWSANRQLAFNADGRLSSAVALIESKLANAIVEAADRRRRAAVMLVHFAPCCNCAGTAPCWDLGLAHLLQRVGNRANEWGPLRLDDTTLVVLVKGLEATADIQRRATDILKSLDGGWCRAGHDRMLECAIGIGVFPEDGYTAASLLVRADEALCDLHAVGHNAAGFSLRRTVRGTFDTSFAACRPRQSAVRSAACGSVNAASQVCAAHL
jgi:predicted signal transduction protein with EAL and GGDEF domain